MIASCYNLKSRKLPIASLDSIMLYFIAFFVLVLYTGLEVRGQCPAVCRCPSSQVANCVTIALSEIPNDG